MTAKSSKKSSHRVSTVDAGDTLLTDKINPLNFTRGQTFKITTALDDETKDIVYRPFAKKGRSYSCIECCQPLVFKQGEVISPHFSHLASRGEADERKCAESLMHISAKYILKTAIESHASICLTPGCEHYRFLLSDVIATLAKAQKDTITQKRRKTEVLVGVEATLGDSGLVGPKSEDRLIRPDLTISIRVGADSPWVAVLAVEVYHTHRVDSSKRATFARNDIPWVEFAAAEVNSAISNSDDVSPFCFTLVSHGGVTKASCSKCLEYEEEEAYEMAKKYKGLIAKEQAGFDKRARLDRAKAREQVLSNEIESLMTKIKSTESDSLSYGYRLEAEAWLASLPEKTRNTKLLSELGNGDESASELRQEIKSVHSELRDILNTSKRLFESDYENPADAAYKKKFPAVASPDVLGYGEITCFREGCGRKFLGTKLVNHFATALASGDVPPNLQRKIAKSGTVYWANTCSWCGSPNYPQDDMVLTIFGNKLFDEGAVQDEAGRRVALALSLTENLKDLENRIKEAVVQLQVLKAEVFLFIPVELGDLALLNKEISEMLAGISKAVDDGVFGQPPSLT